MDRRDDERLKRLLGDPELAWLVERARRRLELGRGLTATIALSDATLEQRQAVHRLLGRPPRNGRTLTVSLPALDAVIRRSGACTEGLAEAIARLGGPVTTRADAAAALAQAWSQAFARLDEAVASSGRVQLAAWLAEMRATGQVKRIEADPHAARALLDGLAVVVSALPASDEPIGRFASRVAGSAHALDDGEPLATLALGAARALSGCPPRPAAASPTSWRREIWAAVGVICDALSSFVLCAGLPGDTKTVSGRIIAAGTAGGQPVALTLRQLVSEPPDLGFQVRDRDVRICENPVVAQLAADRLGERCPPLVCTSGQPGAAVMLLLRRLAEGGARLSHHGDFDWGGLRIGNVLHARLPVRPWRFDARSYAQAVGTYGGPPLRGPVATASWDPNLSVAMLRAGCCVEEESVADSLLADLAASA